MPARGPSSGERTRTPRRPHPRHRRASGAFRPPPPHLHASVCDAARAGQGIAHAADPVAKYMHALSSQGCAQPHLCNGGVHCAACGSLPPLRCMGSLPSPPCCVRTRALACGRMAHSHDQSSSRSEGRCIVLYSVYAVYCIARLYRIALYSDRPVVQSASAV